MASSDFHMAQLPSPPVPLPCVPGPKLAPFTLTAHADIEFLEFLGRDNDVDSLVWKVKINKAGPFALKVFYFCHWDFLRTNQAGGLIRRLANPQLYIDYFDPFNCECRAYGRLKEEEREDLAVKALGYLLLTPQQELDLAGRAEGRSTPPLSPDAATLDGDNFWRRWEHHRGIPVRAIVKELVANKNPDPAQVPRMWSDLQALHSLGIFVNDTHSGNYLDGKLIDFSRSWTMYHPALDHVSAREMESLMYDELEKLLDYYYQLANSGAGSGVVPEDLRTYCSGKLDQYQNFAREYDWLKWEEDLNEAEWYLDYDLFDNAAQGYGANNEISDLAE